MMSDDSILIASGRLLNHFAKQGGKRRMYPRLPIISTRLRVHYHLGVAR